jgi:hypothetical protein
MSDKAVTAPTKNEDMSIQHQNDVSSHALATKVLQEISTGLKNSDYSSGSQAQDDLQALAKDPLQQQVLAQMATDTQDAALMKSLGLTTASFNKGANGDIKSIDFSSDAGIQAYNNKLLSLEQSGQTPTQAASTLTSENFIGSPFFTGKVTLNADGLTPAEEQTSQAQAPKAQDTTAQNTTATAAPAEGPALGYPGSGIVVNGGVDYNKMKF